ncbi:hypothetical protein JTE90_019459 [Oedothorax gibbosus]|uniref:Uncharacterized protein n=1 Tax=Oedothorax gibbosus TaxID=931172 RepID=A0AAV6UV38_9ARAC|nr:hypothetical protein JTE90_019459 [Oedothorax gibbosus]
MAEQEGDEAPSGAAAESPGAEEIPFSFMDKVKFMMYGEQEKEAFLMEKKEKEEKKKEIVTEVNGLVDSG